MHATDARSGYGVSAHEAQATLRDWTGRETMRFILGFCFVFWAAVIGGGLWVYAAIS